MFHAGRGSRLGDGCSGGSFAASSTSFCLLCSFLTLILSLLISVRWSSSTSELSLGSIFPRLLGEAGDLSLARVALSSKPFFLAILSAVSRFFTLTREMSSSRRRSLISFSRTTFSYCQVYNTFSKKLRMYIAHVSTVNVQIFVATIFRGLTFRGN